MKRHYSKEDSVQPKKFNHAFKNKKSGFTLVEMLISVGIFVMTIMALSQIFISVIRSEKIAYALLNGENNIRNGLESVARTIRMGTKFDLSSDGETLKFFYKADSECLQNNDCPSYQYYFVTQTNAEGKEVVVLKVMANDPKNPENNIPLQDLFDPQIEILSGRFYQIGNPTDYQQPSFIIQLQAQVTVRGVAYPLSVETAVTPRILNLP
ncbi:MAG: type II secretion system protein [Candidatus Atribacteria bacterium]|nr:type II secretion system protein [Candidatus Atribacteria bacterium]